MHQPPGCNFLNVIVSRHLVVKQFMNWRILLLGQQDSYPKTSFYTIAGRKTLECAKNVFLTFVEG